MLSWGISIYMQVWQVTFLGSLYLRVHNRIVVVICIRRCDVAIIIGSRLRTWYNAGVVVSVSSIHHAFVFFTSSNVILIKLAAVLHTVLTVNDRIDNMYSSITFNHVFVLKSELLFDTISRPHNWQMCDAQLYFRKMVLEMCNFWENLYTWLCWSWHFAVYGKLSVETLYTVHACLR